jgi:hypothetical protein
VVLDLAAHGARGDRRDLRLDALDVGDLVDALDGDKVESMSIAARPKSESSRGCGTKAKSSFPFAQYAATPSCVLYSCKQKALPPVPSMRADQIAVILDFLVAGLAPRFGCRSSLRKGNPWTVAPTHERSLSYGWLIQTSAARLRVDIVEPLRFGNLLPRETPYEN